MDMKIIKEKAMPLLARKRVTLEANFGGKGTPSIKNLIPQIAKLTKSKPKLVAIRHIYQKYGKTQAKIISHIYDNEKMAKFLEAEKRLFKEEKPKEEEKPAPAEEKAAEAPIKAEEKPKEEVKEAPVKAEEKPKEEVKTKEKPAKEEKKE